MQIKGTVNPKYGKKINFEVSLISEMKEVKICKKSVQANKVEKNKLKTT